MWLQPHLCRRLLCRHAACLFQPLQRHIGVVMWLQDTVTLEMQGGKLRITSTHLAGLLMTMTACW